MKLKHVPFHWLDNCVSQIKFVSTFVNVIFPWCQWWHPMPSYLGCQIFTEHVNFSQLFTLPQYKQGTHSHSHTPISNNTVAVLKWCAVGYIQICTEWEEKRREGWENLTNSSKCIWFPRPPVKSDVLYTFLPIFQPQWSIYQIPKHLEGCFCLNTSGIVYLKLVIFSKIRIIIAKSWPVILSVY